jgi:nucleoside-diphosphate-sugar epimerase
MAKYLITGVAGFIAARITEMLLADDHVVVGLDNLNDYYDVRLKNYRLHQLLGRASNTIAPPTLLAYGHIPMHSLIRLLF